jgi:hypothetical protein
MEAKEEKKLLNFIEKLGFDIYDNDSNNDNDNVN